EVLCVQEERVVGQDWCVRYKNRWLQVADQKGSAGLAGKKVLVKQLGGGQIVGVGGQKRQKGLEHEELGLRPKSTRPAKGIKAGSNRRDKPGPDHPYNRAARAYQAGKARQEKNKPLAA